MSNETPITVVGNLTGTPELRYTPSGKAVANLTVASTPRQRDAAGQWRDLEPLFVRCQIWEQQAEHVAETLDKGARVIVTGRFRARSYEHEGAKRTAWELHVDEIGPALRYATAEVRKAARPAPAAGAHDPWGADAGDPATPSF